MTDKQPDFVTHSEFKQFGDSVNNRFDDMSRTMNSGFNKLESGMTRMQDARTTQWGPIISGAFFIMTVGTLAFAPVMTNQARVETALTKHMELDGHPRAMAIHEQYGPRFESIKDQDKRHTEQIDKLDDKIDKIVERLALREGNAYTAQDALDLERRVGAMEGKLP